MTTAKCCSMVSERWRFAGQVKRRQHFRRSLPAPVTGDTAFACKQVKVAALGRMCTLIKKQRPNLEYLEEVRKHLSRLPSIDPTTRTLIVTGYPNVGKSSFMNKVSRADVEVQPYAFTTKSLFVGHFDYDFGRWQVLDTPGILDHPLEERNTIEMQAITALAHLHATVLFFIDISEQCGFTIEQQARLFENIKPLFTDRPLLIVATKTDAQPWDTLDAYSRQRIEGLVATSGATFATMSNFTDEGVMHVRNTACDVLKRIRVARKMQQRGKIAKVLNRLTVTMPKPRDGRVRTANIPAAVAARRAVKAAAKAEADRLGAEAAAGFGTAVGPTSASGVLTVRGGDDEEDDFEVGGSAGFGMPPASAIIGGGALPAMTASGLGGRAYDLPGPSITGDALVAASGAKAGGAVTVISAAEAAKAGGAVPEGAVVVTGTGPGGAVLEVDRERALGGMGVYRPDDTKDYLLAEDGWKDDVMPQFMDGMNVFDYVDPDILAHVQALEAEEAALLAQYEAEKASGLYAPDTLERRKQAAMAHAVRARRDALRRAAGREKGHNRGAVPRKIIGAPTASGLEGRLIRKGVDEATVKAISEQVAQTAPRGIKRKRGRSRGRGDEDVDLAHADKRTPSQVRGRSRTRRQGGDGEGEEAPAVAARHKSRERSRSASVRERGVDLTTWTPSDGFKDLTQKRAAFKLGRMLQRSRNRVGRKGEADRFEGTAMPKHLYSGKRRLGTHDRR